MKEKVVIVGAGPAGLTCAYNLLKEEPSKYDIVILEKEDTVGGISKSVTFDGYTVDTGIHRFFSKSDMINKIWLDLIPLQNKPTYDQLLLNKKINFDNKVGSDPEKDEKSMLIKERITRIYYDKKFYDYPINVTGKMLKNLGFYNIIMCFCSYLKYQIFKKEETSLENFYINKFGKRLYNMFFESYTEKVWGVHPSKLSSDWGAQRTKNLSIMGIISDMIKKKLGTKTVANTNTSLIENFLYPKLGSLQIWNIMKDEIIKMGGKIEFSSTINNLKIKNNSIYSITYLKNNKSKVIKCNKFISSMPIKELIKFINKDIKVPKDIYKAAINLPYREFMSVCMVLKKCNWKNNIKDKKGILDIPLDSWIYIQDPKVKLGRMQIFNNWSCYLFNKKEDCKDKILIGLEYFCSLNDKYWNMSDEEFIDFATSEIIKLNLISSKDDIISSKRIKIEKAYPAYFGAYDKIDDIKKYLNSIDNLYCIGRNGQHHYNNMDHAMLTGIEASKTIINNIKNKDNIWNINIEKEYHEIKK